MGNTLGFVDTSQVAQIPDARHVTVSFVRNLYLRLGHFNMWMWIISGSWALELCHDNVYTNPTYFVKKFVKKVEVALEVLMYCCHIRCRIGGGNLCIAPRLQVQEL